MGIPLAALGEAGVQPEGEFIDEVALAARVSTSRTPVSETLQRLQLERGDWNGFAQLDQQFHAEIVRHQGGSAPALSSRHPVG